MKTRISIICLILLLAIACDAFCLPWKTLHSKANNLNVGQAKLQSEDNPRDLEDLYVLGLVYFSDYNHEKAKEIFEKMLRIDSDLIEARWGMAEVLRRQYKIAQSQAELQQVIMESPRFFPAYISLSYIKFNLKQYNQSARFANVVIRRGGQKEADVLTLTRAYLIFAGAKGMIAHKGGLISKIINGTTVFTNIKRARSLMPESAEVYYSLGCFYFLAPLPSGGNIKKAKGLLEEAIARDPKLIDAYVRLAQVYQLKGNIEKFNYYLNMALDLEPENFLANDVKSNTCDFICIEQ